MNIVLFYHSLLSDWNHGNAHFLRGYATELIERGHEVVVFEPRDGWSLTNLRGEHGDRPVEDFHAAYPKLAPRFFDPAAPDLPAVLDQADMVIVHEWNEPDLVARIGDHRRRHGDYVLLFHDTHHRSVTAPDTMARYQLLNYDGVLAYGDKIREIYLERKWAGRVWTWHEAADTRLFYPRDRDRSEGDLVWVGNWGDDERTAELQEFLLGPVKQLRLNARVHGVRYPDDAKLALSEAGIEYGGWLPNFRAPEVFARYNVTLHVPRRPYVQSLPGIPTIRPFEALACGIPLVSSPWQDIEGLFRKGDYLVARSGREMAECLRTLLNDRDFARELAERGRETILARHTCAHRIDQLLKIFQEVRESLGEPSPPKAASSRLRRKARSGRAVPPAASIFR